MIVGAHVVLVSNNPEVDHAFFRDVLQLSSVAAGGGYVIFGLPQSEASIHQTDGEVPRHELYFLCDDVNAFAADMKERGIECGAIQNQGWGELVEIKLPSGAPLRVYQPRHERPSD
ncbi:MAG: extradiol dioxygenase [Pyrinomonadaceae bacterium]